VSTSWETITQRLRNELQEYGALLGLFADQQTNLLRRDATAVLQLANAIDEQVQTTQACREHREEAILNFAVEQGQPVSASLRQLLKFFPTEVQPLLQALIDEINHLIHRLRRGARQNQVLLSRTVEAHDEALRTLRPDMYPKTYSRRGSIGSNSGAHALQAAG
jgi:flagellar biosynthesis/type III secretory pathway chaperone